MNSFRYQAIETSGGSVQGVIEAEDRRAALQLLGQRGLFPSSLELCTTNGAATAVAPEIVEPARPVGFRLGQGVSRKQITAFTREMSALLAAAIPIPQALDSLGEEEENQALRQVILGVAESVRKGSAFSTALEEHPHLFSRLYVSMVRVGEEAGVLPKVMTDLANLLEHEDEVRGEVFAAISYPLFVLGFGCVTVVILMTFVLPKLSRMLQETVPVLPLPTLVLVGVSSFLAQYWLWLLLGTVAVAAAISWFLGKPQGQEIKDRIKLRIPIIGRVCRSAALARFARTLGTLAHSGVSLLPALKIVENTIGNRVLARQVAQVAEETRGGDSLAAPLRKLGIFPRTVVQMIDVGEESGTLDQMLLKVAEIEERHMRAKTKTLISLLAPVLIVIVGAIVAFIVIALLLPIFRISRGLH